MVVKIDNLKCDSWLVALSIYSSVYNIVCRKSDLTKGKRQEQDERKESIEEVPHCVDVQPGRHRQNACPSPLSREHAYLEHYH